MTKKFVFRSNKYNITHQDTQRGIEDRGYIDSNPLTSNQSNPLDKWYTYQAARNDENIFPSSSVNITRMQIHDAISRYYDFLSVGQVQMTVELEKTYHVGYNFGKQKLYNYVEEFLLQNPDRVFEFVKDSQQFLVNLSGLPVKNILVHQGSFDENNTTLPLLKTNIGEKVGHHKDGKFERGLQGPFTEHNVGGYKHRHQNIGTTSDRPERFTLSDDGTTITIKSPVSGNLNNAYSRFSRDNFTKSVVNFKNVRIVTGSNTLGNFTKNYQIINGLNRRNQNLAFVDRPQNFNITTIDSPYISGAADHGIPDRRLLDGTYNKTVYVNKFGAPGDSQSITPIYMDQESEEYSPYNTLNYRNSSPRASLKSFLSSASYFGGFLSGSYNVSASYQKTQRNNRYVLVSGTSNLRLRPDNGFVNYQIPSLDKGFLWINNYASDGINSGLLRNGFDNDITFITNSVDNIGLSRISSSFYTFSGYTATIDPLETNALRKYNIKINGLWNFSSKQQLTNHDGKIVSYQRQNNIFTDEIYSGSSNYKQPVATKDSAIKDKYVNTVNIYEKDGKEEILSYEFAQNYSSIMSNYYDVQNNRIDNFYKDYRNIKFKDKDRSLFKKLLNVDRANKTRNLNLKKIKGIKYQEKIYPRGQNAFRNFARVRNAYTQSWSDSLDNRLTELTNSQGKVYYTANILNGDSSNIYKYSYWPMDASTTYQSGYIRDKSGELLQIDNHLMYQTQYNSPSGASSIFLVPSGSYFGARFGRYWNVNRPANVVHEQAGRGPYPNSYDEFTSDIKLIGQNCSVIPEYRISPRLDTYYNSNISYYSDTFNTLELTGTVIEDATLAISTSSAFLEQRVNSDYIDLNEYLNKELTEFKLNTIKLKVKGIKKFLPYDGFYPQQRMLNLATYFSSSYKDYFTFSGPNSTFRTVLTPFYAPGIGFNSVKAGVGMPFSIPVVSGANAATLITSSLDVAASYYYKLPWDTILYPRKRLREISDSLVIYDIDPDMPLRSEATIQTSTTGNYYYDYVANNFYSEVVNFFKDSSTLTSLKSRPSNQWYFPDLTKKYAMDIIINKEGEFYTYSSFHSFGPRPHAFHAPPWHSLGAGSAFGFGINADLSQPPNSVAGGGYTYATIVFDPASLAVGDLSYFVKGQFNIGDVLRNSTVSYGATIVNYNTSSATIQIGDIVDLFSVSADGLTWQPKLKWECPTANLNFNGLSAKLTNSSGNDSGDSTVGSAIRGVWHQYAPISNNNDGLFLSVRNSNVDASLTGSLLDVVGFDKSVRGKIGEIATTKRIVEGLVIIPYYLDNCGEEKYFDINIDLFERLYSENTGIVGEMKVISRNYILPPQMDFIKFREQARKKLKKDEYESVKSPFIMFPFEFSSTLTQQDLADIWQGVLPASADTAEIDYQEKEFFIGSYLRDLNFKLPDNTRFKIFKVKKRAIINYEEINYKSLGYGYSDNNYGYNWPYDFFSLLEMAEVKAELTYTTEVTEDIRKTEVNDLGSQIQRGLQEITLDSTSDSSQTTTATTPERTISSERTTTSATMATSERTIAPERTATSNTGVTELNISSADSFGVISNRSISTDTFTSTFSTTPSTLSVAENTTTNTR